MKSIFQRNFVGTEVRALLAARSPADGREMEERPIAAAAGAGHDNVVRLLLAAGSGQGSGAVGGAGGREADAAPPAVLATPEPLGAKLLEEPESAAEPELRAEPAARVFLPAPEKPEEPDEPVFELAHEAHSRGVPPPLPPMFRAPELPDVSAEDAALEELDPMPGEDTLVAMQRAAPHGAAARLLASLLNEPAVRGGLASNGIIVPSTTLFLAGLHDTTTDNVLIYDGDHPSPAHANAIDQARARVGAGIPLVHRVKRLGRLMDRKHRAFRQHGQV